MDYTIVKNLSWTTAAHSAIKCDVNFTDILDEFVPFTAVGDDIVQHGGEIYTRAINGDFGDIAPFVPVELPPSTPMEIRDIALNAMIYDYGDGRVIQIRPPKFAPDESNIRNAIERMTRLSITEQPWYMLDNITYSVTINDLQIALDAGQDQGALIWETFFTSIGE